MDYKSYFLENYNKLYTLKELLKMRDSNYFDITIINEQVIDSNTISIVMTACNRSKQTYFTLKTIAESSYKNVQIIIVDDSSSDKISINELEKYNLHIELINIKNKFWVNPCINYDIGFSFIKGSKIIIQNSEVCHVGDIVDYVYKNIVDNEYNVFNVISLKNLESNNQLYRMNVITSKNYMNLNKHLGIWYQHPKHRNKNYHFLTALTKNTFDIIGGFDIDYALGKDYDDNGFLLKIMFNKIKINNVNEETLMGIHQWHEQSACGSVSKNYNNEKLFKAKSQYNKENETYLELTSYNEKEAYDIINKIL
ncbi:glycosyl transferase family 2 [Fadolivirus algeromassiliense]|jgi:glycosyltransferase involved in cell wall biosynthesis|uniref:Glycosyl transferase family 2 n=1 Tax=Fadolivirus FV1/VV64 TaxID=3070911 RepID=A0A7D3UTL1_9VIRU|nr:glycosyl transferase family 2 [Fadolivirus algeromassiliense]QKF93571.1 glycosyl transferase family 2 [Fadolivirus FV1/VV64]